MKRSTLTLSILTALLVSACGGSSSNDEQTKDPTPPKVTPTTPTNPSTPSTGKTTSTTGNKDNAGSSGSSAGSSASSSSSDPTPPISSGSAPSGGKPIVVTPTKPEPNPDPDEPTDPDEPAAGSLAAAQEAFEKAKTAFEDAKSKLEAQNSTKGTLWGKQDEKLKAIAGDLGIITSQPDARLESIKAKIALLSDTPADVAKKATAEEALKVYESMKEAWLNAKAQEKEDQTALEKAQKAEFTAKRDLALEEVKAGRAKGDDVKSEKDYFAAKEKQAKDQFKVDEAQLKLTQLAAQKQQLTNDKNVLEDEKKDLAAAKTIAASDDKLKAKIEEQEKDVAAKITKLDEKIGGIEAEEALATAKKTRYAADLLPDDKFNKLKEIAGNRGVAGGSGLSSNNFVEIQVAELDETSSAGAKTWKLTFKDGTEAEINAKTTSGTLNNKVQKSGDVYAYFGKVGEKITAFNPSKATGNASIYGYIGDKFYSVGKVTEADVVNKIKDGAVVYKGKALLSASGKGLVSTFTGTANFNDNTFNGSFKEFASYDRTKTDSNVTVVAVPEDLKGKLPETVDFESKISDNKFEAKIVPNKANVYGFFYGKDTDEKPAEVGGLVEYKNVFHGSFGGAK